MLRAVILSEPGSGSTTFVGLLYLTLTRRAMERPDSFRFASPPDSMRHLTSLYESLAASEFPPSLGPEATSQVRLDLAFRPATGWSRLRSHAEFEPRYRAELVWSHAGLDATARALEGGETVPGMPAGLSSCTTPVFVLEPRSPASVDGGAPGSPTARDDAIQRILRELARSAVGTGGASTGRLAPIFVFTKLDLLTEDLAGGIPKEGLFEDARLRADAARIGARLMATQVPRAVAFCRSTPGTVSDPMVFLTFVRPSEAGRGGGALMRTVSDHRPEPVYPVGQFRAFVDLVERLASSGG